MTQKQVKPSSLDDQQAIKKSLEDFTKYISDGVLAIRESANEALAPIAAAMKSKSDHYEKVFRSDPEAIKAWQEAFQNLSDNFNNPHFPLPSGCEYFGKTPPTNPDDVDKRSPDSKEDPPSS